MPTISGRCQVSVNGVVLLTKSGVKIGGIGGLEREGVYGDSPKAHGHTEKAVPATVDMTITDRDDISLTAIANIKGAVVSAEIYGGKSYVSKNAFCRGNLEMTTGTGETPVVFEGDPWEEQLD